MKNLNNVAKDLFNKIRGRFPSVTIGDANGVVTNVPEEARFFDFTFSIAEQNIGKVSVGLDEENGVTVVVSKDLVKNQPEEVQDNWYSFLRELRILSKKKLLNFDVRDINKSNLNKRDYNFLATNRPGEDNMNESKLYGTNKTSFLNIGNARLRLKHSAPINPEVASSRTQHVESIYIESPTGERFKYPFKHITGAKAMARHVSEGGNAYDDFGKHIVSLSEELSKLKTFKRYMGRSTVMAESLAEYMDIVNERITTVKKTLEQLQKESHYKEAFDTFETPVMEEVPAEVAENWIDQLTIKQFNEELKDVFPYIYKLVGEATKAKELGPEDLVAEAEDPCWKNYKQVGMKTKNGKKVPNCVPEEVQLEQGFEQMMGQFSDQNIVESGNTGFMRFAPKKVNDSRTGESKVVLIGWVGFGNRPNDVKQSGAVRNFALLGNEEAVKNAITKTINDKMLGVSKLVVVHEPALVSRFSYLNDVFDWVDNGGAGNNVVSSEKEKDERPDSDKVKVINPNDKDSGTYASADVSVDKPAKKTTYFFSAENEKLMAFLKKKKPEMMQQYFRPAIGKFVMNEPTFEKFKAMIKSPEAVRKFGETLIMIDRARSFSEDLDEGIKGKLAMLALLGLTGLGAMKMTDPTNSPLGQALQSAAQQGDQEAAMHLKKLGAYIDGGDSQTLKMLNFRYIDEPKASEDIVPEKPKTPLGEFILSHYDRETGKFPKGETAVLTAVEKDYGDQYVQPAANFIQKIQATTLEYQTQEQLSTRYPETDMIKKLAGL